MKRLLLFILIFCNSLSFYAQDVLISQYIETDSGSTPKGIEIVNVSTSDIVFSNVNNLEVYMGNNGSNCVSDNVNITTGTLSVGEVWVIGTTDLVDYANTNGTNLSGTTLKSFNFNGDDALQIYLGGVLQDVFGTCGVDPGTSWTGGGVSTRNNNLELKNGICTTDGDWTDPSIRFNQIANGSTMTGFGNAPISCTGAVITATPLAITGLDYELGTGPSNFQSFSFSAQNLTPGSDVTITAPSNYEIATSGAGPYFTVITTPSNASGTIPSTNMYVRLIAGLVVGISGPSDIVLSASGASDVNVSVTGEVTAPSVNFILATDAVSESAGTANIQVESSTSGSLSVDVTVTGGSATNGIEYTFTAQTVDFSAATIITIPLTIIDDIVCSGSKDIIFTLSNPINCDIGSTPQLTLTIMDDEANNATIDYQGFEGGGWAYTASPGSYIVSDDVWAEVGSVGTGTNTINPSSGLQLWGIRDIDNNNGGGNFDHILTFTKDISAYMDVQIAFNWSAYGYESSDYLKYELIYDGTGQGEVSLCSGCTSSWTTETLPIPNTVTTVGLRLIANQNGAADYAGFDNVSISGLGCNTCSVPTVNASFNLNTPTNLNTITTTNPTSSNATLTWNGGDGENSVVVMREGSAVGSAPQDNITYAANSDFGSGPTIGSNDYVVYNGSGNSVDVTNLVPGGEYFVEIYEYNCLPGIERYLTTSYGSDVFVTRPVLPTDLNEQCTTNNSYTLNWNTPIYGSYTGYLLVGRANGVPGGVTSIDPSVASSNTNFSAAQGYPTIGDPSKILYIGNGNSATITGLTMGTNYTFRLYTYKIGSTEYRYSETYRQASETIQQEDVPSYGGFAGDTEANISWQLPESGCWDEIMVVATVISGIEFSPSGDGSAYSPSSVYSAPLQVVYLGTGTNTTITNLNNSTAYGFEIFVRNGTTWSPGVEIILVPSTATILEPGDLAIVAVNTSTVSGDDEFCFVSFKDINESTSIDFTDNGYERVDPDFWAGTEGTVRVQRTGGGVIPAGEVICIRGKGNGNPSNDTPPVDDFEIYRCGVLDNTNWTTSSLNGDLGLFDINVDDQIWIMQGGAWTGGWSNGSPTHDGLYSGNVLYGWTAVGWEPSHGYNDPKGSTLYPSSKCFTTSLNGINDHDKVKYTGDMTSTNQLEWISRINDTNNWTGYSDNSSYDANGPQYSQTCINFSVSSGNYVDGKWTGAVDDQWFECGNWENLRVPLDSTDVDISVTTNPVVIDQNHADALLSDMTAKCDDLVMNDNSITLVGPLDNLTINGELFLLGNTLLSNKNGGTVEVFGPFEAVTNTDIVDFSSSSSSIVSKFILHNRWTIGADPVSTSYGFIEEFSLVTFVGNTTQALENFGEMETFYNLKIDKPNATKVQLEATSITVTNELEFGNMGFIDASDDPFKVIIDNTNVNAIVGYEPLNGTGSYPINDKYIYGRLERNVISGSSYDFPVGDRPSVLGYNPVKMDITNQSGYVSAIFDGQSPGYISVFNNTLICNGAQRILNYDAFMNTGFWNLTGPSTMEYTIEVHPNTNTNAPLIPQPSAAGYRLLKAPSGSAGLGNTWPTTSAYEGDMCALTTYYAASESYTGFSDFSIVGDALDPAILPIELISFTAKTQERDILLQWTTATELNNSLFILHHSVDGENWEVINTQPGAGNSSAEINYDYLHVRPTWGAHYYRLEQVDYDGANAFSEAVVASIGNPENIDVYPIPVDNILYINTPFELDAKSIVVRNNQGQRIGSWQFDGQKMDVTKLPDGIYYISFIGMDTVVVKKFIKTSTY